MDKIEKSLQLYIEGNSYTVKMVPYISGKTKYNVMKELKEQKEDATVKEFMKLVEDVKVDLKNAQEKKDDVGYSFAQVEIAKLLGMNNKQKDLDTEKHNDITFVKSVVHIIDMTDVKPELKKHLEADPLDGGELNDFWMQQDINAIKDFVEFFRSHAKIKAGLR